MAETEPVRLIDEAPFLLGGITVTPSTRTLATPGGTCVIEPRVMQVLVTFVRRRNEVVGRDALVDACWDGRIVGEDVINRAILKLRRALEEVGGGVTIETVAKVGYRLCVLDPAAAAPQAPRHAPVARRRVLAGAGAVLALGAIGLAVGLHGARDRTRVVVVQPLRVGPGDAPARRMAQDLASDLSRAVLGHDGALAFADASVPSRTASFIVRGSVATVGHDLHAVVDVSDGADPAILWSHDYTAPLADVASLRQQVSTNLAAVLICAIGTRGVPDGIDARTTALYLEACNLRSGDQRQETYLIRQVIARAPRFASAWADLAISLAFASADAGDEDARAMRAEAAGAARRALALDPHLGNGYYAQALLLQGMPNWIARERVVDAGLKAEPDNPQLYSRHAIDLAAIGLLQDSIAANRRAVALDPLFPGKTAGLVRALANAGELDEAEAAVRHMQETWPDSTYTWHARFETAARIGDPREAEAMLDEPDKLGMEPSEIAGWRIFLKARASPTEHNVDSAIAALWDQRRRGRATDAQLLSDLTLLGHPKEALDVALHMPPGSEGDFWFKSLLAPVRADPRFMIVAQRQGFVALWRASGLWPDFCRDGSVPYDCRKVAATVDPLRKTIAANVQGK